MLDIFTVAPARHPPSIAPCRTAAKATSTSATPAPPWQRGYIDAETRALLDEDARWFLHQSLSTPCFNVLERAEGIWLIDVDGRRIMDFHGNSVHQVGYGHPRVIEAVKRQLDTLPFSPRRYTNRAAVELARRLAELAPGDSNKVLFAPCGTSAIGMALKLARHCHRPAQDALDVGRVPRRLARRDLDRRRSLVPARRRPAAAGHRACAAARSAPRFFG